GDLEVPRDTLDEINVLKSLAAHHVMRADPRVRDLAQQRDLLHGLVAHLRLKGEGELEPEFATDFRAAADDAQRLRVIVDQVASLTDASARAWARRLLG
ncbi:MAG: deoxyguanosinetriphosphate triphosphohydrolase, partial [Aeromicrobium sp.]